MAFISRKGGGFSFCRTVGMVLRPIRPTFHWASEHLSLRLKRPEPVTDNIFIQCNSRSFPFNVYTKMHESVEKHWNLSSP
jgi:hypothetical protein